mgnify:FL=1
MINMKSKRDTNIAVTLTPCCFKKNTYIARVPRKTLTTDQILDLVASHNQGIDRYQVGHAMELLKKEILEQAKLGFAVDIMEICKLYIAPISAIQSLKPEAEKVTGFEARFTPNDELKETLKGITATVSAVVDSSPQITQIENPTNGATDGKLKATFSARLKGKKLKIGGENRGIYFLPVLDDKTPDMAEENWIKVPDDFITTNSPTLLEFYIPRTLETGKSYFIAARTSIRGTTTLKNPVTGISSIAVTIEE